MNNYNCYNIIIHKLENVLKVVNIIGFRIHKLKHVHLFNLVQM